MTNDGGRLAEFIAVRDLAAVDPVRGEFSIVLRIGRPYQISEVEWACPVALEGLYAGLRDQHGSDSFQALVLALRLARTLLGDFVEKGGRLVGAEARETISVDDIFTAGTP